MAMIAKILPTVVPANAGAHNHRPWFLAKLLWVPDRAEPIIGRACRATRWLVRDDKIGKR